VGGPRASDTVQHHPTARISLVPRNLIASSIVGRVAIERAILQVCGLDCLDGTPLINLKPESEAAGE
jgi:tRNA (Thr-GGU) A37 N-methylase